MEKYYRLSGDGSRHTECPYFLPVLRLQTNTRFVIKRTVSQSIPGQITIIVFRDRAVTSPNRVRRRIFIEDRPFFSPRQTARLEPMEKSSR